ILIAALLGDPLYPAPVQDTEAGMPEVLQHPKHPSLIAPVIEWVRVDHDIAVVTDSKTAQLLLERLHVRIQQTLDGRGLITKLMPGCMNSARNVAAERIGGLPPSIDDHQTFTPEVLLQRLGVDQKRVHHLLIP